jgi:hypothetical protein
MKTMVIGLGPEYNYKSDDHSLWRNQNTRYASNHGASLISRTLINLFNADYIDDFTNPEKYREDYDLCVIAFATHITANRDVSIYTDFTKKLNIKTVAFSLGIQDYSQSTTQISNLHSSIKELLNFVISKSNIIGVRGPHTKALLLKDGFKSKNIRAIGCPTLFGQLNRDLKINKPVEITNPAIVFHRTFSELNKQLISAGTLIGQDFLDESVFTDSFPVDNPIYEQEINEYANSKNGDFTLARIKSHGMFPYTFDNWFAAISQHDFIFGPRLHGCIAALLQGIPAVMIARDVRVTEIADFFKIPYLKYEDINEMTCSEIFKKADYSKFNILYSKRFDNFVKLLSDIDVLDKLQAHTQLSIPEDYIHISEDSDTLNDIVYLELNTIRLELKNLSLKQNILEAFNARLKRLPGVKYIASIFK